MNTLTSSGITVHFACGWSGAACSKYARNRFSIGDTANPSTSEDQRLLRLATLSIRRTLICSRVGIQPMCPNSPFVGLIPEIVNKIYVLIAFRNLQELSACMPSESCTTFLSSIASISLSTSFVKSLKVFAITKSSTR